MRVVSVSMVGFVLAASLAAQVPTDRRQFVACPIVRDTKTQPCWLAEYKGETYYLGQQGGVINDFYPPQLNHEILVEGAIAAGPRVCGGIPLRPVKISVMRELNQACNTMLPAEDGIEAPPPVPPPGIGKGPSWVKSDSPDQTTIYFDFDNDFLSAHSTAALNAIAASVKQSRPARIEVTGYRGATLLTGGETLTEREKTADVRARKVAEILIGLGVPKELIAVSSSMAAAKPDGVNDAWSRKVVVVISH